MLAFMKPIITVWKKIGDDVFLDALIRTGENPIRADILSFFSSNFNNTQQTRCDKYIAFRESTLSVCECRLVVERASVGNGESWLCHCRNSNSSVLLRTREVCHPFLYHSVTRNWVLVQTIDCYLECHRFEFSWKSLLLCSPQKIISLFLFTIVVVWEKHCRSVVRKVLGLA